MDFFPNAESILQINDLDFRILQAYYQKHNKFEESHRKDLARIVVALILTVNPDIRVEPAHFRHLARVVADAFPTEIPETYYIPSGGSKAPTGKLYSQYNNYKSKLNQVGLCTRRSKTNPNAAPAPSSSIPPSGLLINSVEIKEEKFDDAAIQYDPLEVVRSNDWSNNDRFIECWNATYEQRQEMLSQLTTLEYLAAFPYTLQSDIGYEIIVLDAHRKFPALCEDKSELISRVAPLILSKLQHFRSEQMVINMLRKFEKENSKVQTLLAITLLPFLFTPTLLTKKRKLDASLNISAKPTKSDAYRCFFSNFETNADLQNFKSMMNTQNAPKIYTIGNLKENPIVIIQLAGIEYIIEDPILGFQTFFKLFYGLNLEYSPEAHHAWTFVERFFYEMEYTIDNNAQMRTYVNEFKIFNQTQMQKTKIEMTCNLCSAEFNDAKSYISHYMDHRQGKETSEFICCGRIFGNMHHFGKHLNDKHQVNCD